MEPDKITVNSKYKDSVFRKLFGENKENALSLAGAIMGRKLPPDTELEYTTIGDMIYMNIKNDVSFMIHDCMYMVEHQSTVNPNMPLRELQYYMRQVDKIVANNERLYSHRKILLPTPINYVFCNAEDMKKDWYECRLSDLFIRKECNRGNDWVVQVVNINAGRNEKFMAACEPLRGYSIFVDKARKWQAIEPGVKGDLLQTLFL